MHRAERVAIYLLCGIIVIFFGCSSLTTPEGREKRQIEADNKSAAYALGRIEATEFVYDPTSQACWAVYNGYREGSVDNVSCAVARRRMVPSQLKALANAEAKLGHPIP